MNYQKFARLYSYSRVSPGSGESVTFTEYPNLFIFPLNSLVISEIIRNFATVLLTS